MPLFSQTEAAIFGDVLYDIVNSTNLTRVSPGSKTRAIAQALSRKLNKMWRQFDLNVVQSFLTGAEGRYLDLVGILLATPRLGEVTASVTSNQRLVRCYVDVGTFGDINSSQSIHLPKNTVISTQPYGEGVRYRLPYAVILSSGQNNTYIPVEAMVSGSGANIGIGQLRYIDFSDYTDVLNNSLKVTNDAEVVVGQEVEGDVNYRYRLANKVISAETGNETSIRLAALMVPGVADVITLKYFRGIGTYDLLIKATVPVPSAGLIAAVQEVVERVTAQGIVPRVRAPVDIGMSLIASVTFRKVITPTEQSNILNTCMRNVTDYINNLDIAEDFIVNEVVERVMATSDLIKNIGSASKPIDSLWIHTPSQLEDNKVRTTLIGDYTPESDAKLSVETLYGGATPILVKVAS